MKSILNIISILIFIYPITSCNTICTSGNGKMSKKEVSFFGVSKLKSSGSFDVHIEEGTRFNVVAKGDENILNALEIKEKDGECTLSFKKGCYTDYDLAIHITMPAITSLKLGGSGNIYVGDFRAAKALDAAIGGSGNIQLSHIYGLNEANLSINGSGNIEFKEHIDAKKVNSRVNGSGSVLAKKVKCQEASIKINGSGDTYMNVENTAKVNINGSGNATIIGNPSIDKSISGSGQLKVNDN